MEGAHFIKYGSLEVLSEQVRACFCSAVLLCLLCVRWCSVQYRHPEAFFGGGLGRDVVLLRVWVLTELDVWRLVRRCCNK